MDQPAWNYEYSVEAEATPAFAWSYWTDIRNWSDPPAQFSVDGGFAEGAQGHTLIPGQEPIHWAITNVAPGKSATIQMPLPGAVFSSHWRFEPLPCGRTRITQRLEMTGENAGAYEEARAAFSANLPAGMKKIAAAMSEAMGHETG